MMSLFDRLGPRDQTASSGAPSGGLFGASTAAPTGASLFSAPSNNTTTTGASLFSQPANNNTASTNTSLFSKPTTAATGTSLFAQPTNTSAPSGASLFGGAQSSTQTSQPAQPTQSLFGATTIAQVQPSGNASLFGSNFLPSSKPQETSSLEQASDPNAAPSQPAYFHALLEKNKKRSSDDGVNGLNQLPQLQLGLNDISRKVRNIGQGGPSAGLARAGDVRPSSLLAASGVNTSKTLRDIDELASFAAPRADSALEAQDYSAISGVKDSLTAFHQNSFEQMWQGAVKKAQDDFNRMIDRQLHDVDWHAHRQRIYEHFGLKKPQSLENGAAPIDQSLRDSGKFGRSSRRSRVHGQSAFGQSFGLPGLSKSIIGTPGPRGARQSAFGDIAERLPADGLRPAPEDRVQRIKQEKYADRIAELNVARLQEKCFPAMTRFAAVESEPSNEDTSMLVNAYNALVSIVGEDASVENVTDPGAVRERQFAQSYLDDSPSEKGHTSIRKRIIDGSRTYLEKQFYAQVEATVNKNPREANVGGVPTAIAVIKGYVRVRASRKELGPDVEMLQEIDGDYCWAVVFYLLRSGLFHATLQYVEENQAAFRQIGRSFVRYLRAFVGSKERRLPSEMQTAINNEYSQRQRLAPEDSNDPYRMMCFKVIGRCDLNRRSLDNITNDMLDWIWLQFAMAREYNRVDEFAHEAFGLEELQQSIKEIGNRYFGAGSDIANAPTTFFFMQILAGMFENAVAELYPHNYVSATHFAIALDFYGLLRVSDVSNSEDLLTYTTRQQPQIAFGSMVGLYTRDFRTANATAAIDYITLICLNSDLTGELGKVQRELCYQALIEVTLETREFAELLGDIRSDGQRIKGAIEQRLKLIKLDNEREFLKNITLVAARTAEEQSRVTDSVLLFHLAEDYDKVIQVVNEAVSLALTVELGDQPARLTPLKPRSQPQPPSINEQPQSSLSLTAVDDPIDLARNMTSLYGSNAMYFEKVKPRSRDVCLILLRLADARKALEAGKWPLVVDHVTSSRLLPTQANGNISAIRGSAQAFNDMPAVLARTIAPVMLWTVVACSNQVERLRNQEFDTGTQHEAIAMCVQTARDVMVFAGLIRYRLPGRTWEALARAGQDLGAY